MKTKTQHVTNVPASIALDQCRVAFNCSIAMQMVESLVANRNLPVQVNRKVLRDTQGQLQRCINEMKRTVEEHEPYYLDRTLKQDKLQDISTMVDAMARIGIENGGDVYEEFFSLVVELIDAVFYAQENRKKMHFNKFKALFQLIASEIKADVNDGVPQLIYRNRELYIRPLPLPPTEMG